MTDITTYTEAPIAPSDNEGAASLVHFAIERGVDVSVLERLVALQERVTERNARAAFFEAVADFQEQCPEIAKSKTAQIATKGGGRYSYSYAPLEEITRTIRPLLKRHGLSYSWTVEPGEKVLFVTCVLRHIDGHEERASFPVPVDTAAAMSDAQKNGAALTYGKRQSLTSVLGLTTADEDKDGAGRSVETITANQADALDSLMNEVKVDRRKFLAWLGVGSIGEITKEKYPQAVRALESRRRA